MEQVTSTKRAKGSKGLRPCSLFVRSISLLLAIILVGSSWPISAAAADNNVIDTTDDSLQTLSNTSYGSDVTVYYTVLPKDATTCTLVTGDSYYIRTGLNGDIYVPREILSKQSWYHSVYDAALYANEQTLDVTETWYETYDNFIAFTEEDYHDDYYDEETGKFDWNSYFQGEFQFSSPEEYWEDLFAACYESSCTIKLDRAYGIGPNTFASMFGNSGLPYDQTVKYYLIELKDDLDTVLINRGTVNDGTAKKAILIQVGESVSLDKSALEAVIAEAPKETDNRYYTSDDFYNGKAVSENPNGYWAEYQAALTAAQTTLAKASEQSQLDAAKSALEAAIANLIPKTEANTSVLYEAVHAAAGDANLCGSFHSVPPCRCLILVSGRMLRGGVRNKPLRYIIPSGRSFCGALRAIHLNSAILTNQLYYGLPTITRKIWRGCPFFSVAISPLFCYTETQIGKQTARRCL